jgi:hypothetical protein
MSITRAILRHHCQQQRQPNGKLLEFWQGDDVWSASIHINITWRGRHYWHVFFIPWWPTPKEQP